MEIYFEFLQEYGTELIADLEKVEVNEPDGFVLKGTVSVNSKAIPILLSIPDEFPRILPEIFLQNHDCLGFIPHVEKSGKVCFVQREGILFDQDFPGDLLLESIKLSVSTLEKGVRGENKYDFIKEFESYWLGQPNIILSDSIINLTDKVKLITVWKSTKGQRETLLASDSQFEAKRHFEKVLKQDFTNVKPFTGIYIPLENHNGIYPPGYDDNWTASKLRDVVFNHINESNKNQVYKLLRNKKNLINTNLGFIVICIPHVDGNVTLIGFNFSLNKYKGRPNLRGNHVKYWTHPLHHFSGNTSLLPIHFSRHNVDHMRIRGGATPVISSRHVVIAGIGSVGSRIAMEVVRSGVNNLTLIDPDVLSLDNIYRNELGADKVYVRAKNKEHEYTQPSRKTRALAEEIKEKFPHVQVYELPNTLEEVLTDELLEISKVDLMIVATGDPSGEVYINKFLHNEICAPPTIFTWLEPLGIGGHALLTLNKNRTGCFRCLLHRESLYGPIVNKASFAQSGQNFVKTMSGCSSVYTPFSSLDAVQTAVLATRLAVNVLMGNEEDNPLLSWKGSAEEFLSLGYELSSRYLKSTVEDLYTYRYHYKDDSCPVCHKCV